MSKASFIFINGSLTLALGAALFSGVNANADGAAKSCQKALSHEVRSQNPVLVPPDLMLKTVWGKSYSDDEISNLRSHIAAAVDASLNGKGDVNADQVRQNATYHFIRQTSYKARSKALLLGNAEQEPSAAMIKQIEIIAASAKVRGFVIYYDADAKTAPYIRENGGDWALGISARSPQQIQGLKNTISLENPYLRLKFFQETGKAVISPSSVIGQALWLTKNKEVNFLWSEEKDETLMPLFDKWLGEAKKFELGLSKYEDRPTIAVGVQASPETDKVVQETPPDFSLTGTRFKKWINNLYDYGTNQILEPAQSMANGLQEFEDAQVGSLHRPTVAVLGSSQEHDQFNDLVKSVVLKFGGEGRAVFTGGSSGFMRLANAAAFEKGVPSIGIPMKAGFLKKESHVATDVQNITVTASDYSVRIPLLVSQELIAFAPGGKGTVKELAALLVQMSDPTRSDQMVYFISSKYYGSLLAYFKRAGLPSSLLNRFKVIDDPAQIVTQEKVP